MLITIKHSLRKNKQNDLAAKLKVDADSFMESIVCSIKNGECFAGTCPTCLENHDLNEVFSILSEIEEVTYSQWTRENKCWVKKQYTDSVADVVAIFKDLSNFQSRSRMCNIYRQFSELKYLVILKMLKSFSV